MSADERDRDLGHGVYEHTMQFDDHQSSLEHDMSMDRVSARPEIGAGPAPAPPSRPPARPDRRLSRSRSP